MNRESGFYWVKIKSKKDIRYKNNPEWEIAEYSMNSWNIIGINKILFDSDFLEIDENRIIRSE